MYNNVDLFDSERFQNYSKIKRKDFCVLPLFFVYIDFTSKPNSLI